MLSQFVTDTTVKKNPHSFPGLYISTCPKDNQVVIFFSGVDGLVIQGSNIGMRHSNWVNCLDSKVWRRLKTSESVVLMNEV